MSKEKDNYTGLLHNLDPCDENKAYMANEIVKTKGLHCLEAVNYHLKCCKNTCCFVPWFVVLYQGFNSSSCHLNLNQHVFVEST
jgi:hypothetical protein